MNKTKIIYSLLILIFLGGNVFLGLAYANAKYETTQSVALLEREKTNTKILDFMKVFIDKVVQNDREVDFDTRLDLENRVRELNNQQILDQWNRFTKSGSEAQAQAEVKKLLLLLIAEAEK